MEKKPGRKLPSGAKYSIETKAERRRKLALPQDVIEALEQQDYLDEDLSDARRFAGRPDY